MRTTAKLVLAVLGVGLLAACTPEVEEVPSPSPTPTVTTVDPTPTPSESPSPTPSPSPTVAESFSPPPATAGEEELAIRQALIDYYAVLDKFGGDPTLTDLTETQYVTTGEESTVIVQEITQLRENGHIAVGGRSIHNIEVGDPETNNEGVTIATIAYCEDRSQIRILDSETLEDTGLRPLAVVESIATVEQGADDKWRIAMIRTEQAESC